MTRTARILLGVVLVAVAIVGVAWFRANFERVEEEFPLPARGEAKTDPLYALRKVLVASGQRVALHRRIGAEETPLRPEDTVVLADSVDHLPQADAKLLLAWVARGGHLLAPVHAWRDTTGPLLDALSIQRKDIDDDANNCVQLWREAADPDERVDKRFSCSSSRFVAPKDKVLVAWEHEGGPIYMRLRHGAGTIDLMMGLQANYTDTGLEGPEEAEFVHQLLAPHWGRGTFHLVKQTEMPPLWRLLLDHAWMAFAPLLLALVGWLFMRAQRFGPLLPSPPEERRALLEHVQATGEHLYRYGRAHLLHAALRAHVLARLRRRDPLLSALDGAARDAAIAAHTGLTDTEVREALQTPRPYDFHDFRQRIARLIALGRHQ